MAGITANFGFPYATQVFKSPLITIVQNFKEIFYQMQQCVRQRAQFWIIRRCIGVKIIPVTIQIPNTQSRISDGAESLIFRHFVYVYVYDKLCQI